MTSAQTSDDVGNTIERTSSLNSKILYMFELTDFAYVMSDDVAAANAISVPGVKHFVIICNLFISLILTKHKQKNITLEAQNNASIKNQIHFQIGVFEIERIRYT